MQDRDQLREVLEFAVEIAQIAGAFTLGHFRTGTPAEIKADNTPVTAADRGAEELLRKRIEAAYPTHGILGEELGEKAGTAPGRWILDPIDGTFSFICGAPLFSVLIGFEYEGRIAAGVMHFPVLGETYYGAKGLGAWCNGAPIRVSTVATLAEARLSTTTVDAMAEHGRWDAYERLRKACAHSRGWADAYGYAMLASGRCDVVVDPIMSIWDCAGPCGVIEAAGGRFSDWAGEDTHARPEAVATNGLLHAEVLSRISG